MDFSNSQFWQDFWPNFWADVVVGLVLTGLISWIYQKTRKVGATLVVVPSHISNETFHLNIYIKNSGTLPFRREEIYWHIFIDQELITERFEVLHFDTDVLVAYGVDIEGRKFVHLWGQVKAAIFPERKNKLLTITAQSPQRKRYSIYYYFSTIYGLIPKSVKEDVEGRVVYDTLRVIKVMMVD